MTDRTLDIAPLQRRIRLQILGLSRMFLCLGQEVMLVHSWCRVRFRLCVFKVGAIAALVEELFGIVVGLRRNESSA